MKKKLSFLLVSGVAAGVGAALFGRKKKLERECLRIDTPRGVDTEEYVTIGGVEQYLCHRGEDVLNPVMLFLHGGPGSPELPFASQFQPAWEHKVTVVHWDQRGCGKTFFRGGADAPNPTMEQLLSDLDEIISYLKGKYHKDRIIIMGHSWGSVLGSIYAHRHPENVLAYIGVGQVVNMQENERIGFQKALEAAQAAGNQGDLDKLCAMEPYPGTFPNMMRKIMKLRQLQIKYKLADGFSLKNAKSVIASPFYSVKDATWFLRPDMMERQRSLFESLYHFDLPSLGCEYQIPFFIIQGEQDFQTPYPLAKDYFATVSAPFSRFYSIPNAGHFTMLDQKLLFNDALFGILGKL